MRFIRKGGRVIPIHERPGAIQKDQERFNKTPRGKTAIKAQKVGLGMMAVGAAAHISSAAALAGSEVTGRAALDTVRMMRKNPKQAAQFKDLARGLVQSSLSAGRLGNRLKTVAKYGIRGGAAVAVAGMAMSAHKIKKPKRK